MCVDNDTQSSEFRGQRWDAIHPKFVFQPHFGKYSFVVQSLCYTMKMVSLVEGEGGKQSSLPQ